MAFLERVYVVSQQERLGANYSVFQEEHTPGD